jgi:hypothetical protein
MLPPRHVAYTLAAINLLQKKIPALKTIDYRWAALAAMGPDLIDKPLAALYFYRKYKAAVLFAHTLLVHGGLLAYVLWRKPAWWRYALVFNGHALLDRLWLFPRTCTGPCWAGSFIAGANGAASRRTSNWPTGTLSPVARSCGGGSWAACWPGCGLLGATGSIAGSG